jgi:autotransporter adhesin
MSAVADRDNTVSIGNSTTQRQLVQVARGTKTTDAVNVSQLTPVVDALGGAAKFNADGTVTAPAYTVGATSYNNVGDAITALGKGNKYLSANDAAGSSAGASAIGSGSISIGGNSVADSTGGTHAALAIGSDTRAGTKATAVGPGATASAVNTVALGTLSVADRAGTVSVGSATNTRQIVNVAAGTQATDVVNVAQLTPVVTALGGKASLNADGSITAPSYNVGTATFTNVGDALSALDNGPSKYFHTNSTLADSTAAGVESIAVGGAANSVNPGDIAIGLNNHRLKSVGLYCGLKVRIRVA